MDFENLIWIFLTLRRRVPVFVTVHVHVHQQPADRAAQGDFGDQFANAQNLNRHYGLLVLLVLFAWSKMILTRYRKMIEITFAQLQIDIRSGTYKIIIHGNF